MKWIAGALLAVFALVGSGCGPSRVVLRGASNTWSVDLSRCAVRQLERLGYTVREGNPKSGLVRATKNTSTTRMVLFSGKDSEDQIIVTTAAGGPDGMNTMRVTGESLFWGTDTKRVAERPSKELARHVNQILEACGILGAVSVESP